MTTHNHNLSHLLSKRLNQLNQYKIDLGLDRLKTVLLRLNLDDISQQVIIVGGTNGKGSTVSALCALLKTKAKQFGAFTSPHIFKFNERININGVLATDVQVMTAFDAIDAVKKDINLSYFEYAFLAALIIFVEQGVDVIVLEVGLGGRLDATNAIDSDLAIITTVDIDHTEWLGDDIESIAKEKAGIMRTQCPVIYGDKNTPTAVIERADFLGALLIQYGQDQQIVFDQQQFSYSYQSQQFESLLRPALQGDYQLKNFSNALTAVLELGYALTHDEVQQSINNWQIKGRLQPIQNEPLVVLDVSHNKQAISQLVKWLQSNPIKGKTRAVFSVLQDKQIDTWLGMLDEVIDHWFVFQIKNQRAMEINDLKAALVENVSLFSRFDTAPEAYTAALMCSEPQDRIMVFGSFHVLEEVFEAVNI